ncbi:YT521-B-like domain-containing protein [Hyaloraphidium curvatum]|nr:YT521-B-like domain-containing protein [Hyaloraphidium curvatum]
MPPQDARGGMPPRRAVDGEAPRMREDRARDRERERDRDRDRERDRGRFGGGPPAEVRRRSRDRSPMQDRYQVPMTRRVEGTSDGHGTLGRHLTRLRSFCSVERPRMDERVPSGRIDPPPPKKDARYFVMRSNNFDNVEISQEKGVWATQKSNSETLSQAFKTCERVVLFFSVNESRHYHGYGEMSTDVGGAAGFDVPWNKIKVLGDNFQVNWLVKKDLPFERISDLKNAWNENKPVKISRDGQELTPEVAKQLIEAFDSFGLESGTARKAYNAAGGSQKPGGRAPRGRPDGRYDGRQSGPGRGPRHAPGGDDRGPRNHPYARDRDGPPMRDPRDGPLRDMPPMRGHDDRFPPQRFAPYPPNRRGGY